MKKYFLILSLLASSAFATDVRLYNAFGDGAYQRDLTFIKTVKGTCTQAQDKPYARVQSWQCSAGDKKYAPCYTHPYQDHSAAICPSSPDSDEAVRIVVDKPLDPDSARSFDASQALPFALSLTNGQICVKNIMQPSYLCHNGQTIKKITTRCGANWKADLNNTLVDIQRAWF